MRKEGWKEQENKERQTLGTSNPATHRVRVKVRFTVVRKGKSPETKVRCDNLISEKLV